MARLPARLERPPLLEAVFEVRFSGPTAAVGDLLPGLLYERLKPAFTNVEHLPVGSLPRTVRESNPELRYQPHVKLGGGGGLTLMIGDHVIALSKAPPYEGWRSFRSLCQKVSDSLHATELVAAVERYSFKCVNIIVADDAFSVLNADLRFDGFALSHKGLRIRAEIKNDPFVTIVEVQSATTIGIGEKTLTGVFLAVDTLREIGSADFWPRASEHLDKAHDLLKATFFGLLKESTIESFGPQWGNT